jgi:hypothetical protein
MSVTTCPVLASYQWRLRSSVASPSDEIAGEVLRLDLAALLAPEPEQGSFVIAHDDPRIGPADEVAAIGRSARSVH